MIAAPVAYLSEQQKPSVYSFIPHAGTQAASAAACSEYVSLFWYSLTNDI